MDPNIKAKVYRHRERKRWAIYQEKVKIGKCQRCGYDKHVGTLHFHHRNPDNKLFGLSNCISCHKSWEKIKEEIDKCELICPNCHAIEHYIEKTKPKKELLPV